MTTSAAKGVDIAVAEPSALAKDPEGAYSYTISGTDGKFVNRFPHKDAKSPTTQPAWTDTSQG